MSGDQDTTAPVTIERVEVACDDPDRSVNSMRKALQEMAARQTCQAAAFAQYMAPKTPEAIALHAKLARRARWRRRLRKVGLSAAVAVIMALAVIGAASLF